MPLEAVERDGGLLPYREWPRFGGCGAQDHYDRRHLSESAPHGFKPAGEKGRRGRVIGRTKVGQNTKLHAIADANGRPLKFFMNAREVSVYTGAASLLDHMPSAEWLLADRGYDAVCIEKR